MKQENPVSAGVCFAPLLAICAGFVAIMLVFFALGAGNHARADEVQPPSGYAAAYAEAVRLGRPLVIEVGAAWCAPCRECEKRYGEELRSAGVFVHVDLDRDRAWLAARHIEPASVPAVIVYARKRGQWVAPRLEIGLPRIGIYIGELRKRRP